MKSSPFKCSAPTPTLDRFRYRRYIFWGSNSEEGPKTGTLFAYLYQKQPLFPTSNRADTLLLSQQVMGMCGVSRNRISEAVYLGALVPENERNEA